MSQHFSLSFAASLVVASTSFSQALGATGAPSLPPPVTLADLNNDAASQILTGSTSMDTNMLTNAVKRTQGDGLNRDQHNPATGINYTIHPPPPAAPLNSAPVRLTPAEKQGQAITHHWRTKKSMPATGPDGTVVFTYGAKQPAIVCAPLTVCLLKLEPGEHITKNGKAIGDPTEWSVKPAVTENGDGIEQTVLVIKPFDSALSTTLALMTDRRIYSIQLTSVAKQSQSMAISEFRYPETEQSAWHDYDQRRQSSKTPDTATSTSPLSLDFHYVISGDPVNWRPLRVFNDGTHTFIQLPDNIRSDELPVLFAKTDGGQRTLLNYHKQGNHFVVDHLFESAVLQLGLHGHKKTVRIKHNGAWS